MRLRHGHPPASACCRLLVLAAVLTVAVGWGTRSRVLGAGDLGAWLATGSLTTARAYHSDVLLPNGHVLIVGGVDASGSILSRAELYDPQAGRWTRARDMSVARAGVAAVLLRTGQVLVAGGVSGMAGSGPVLASAEIYDPASGVWTTTGRLAVPRYDYSATLLPSGTVLVAGGVGVSGATLSSAELYDPVAGRWAATSTMTVARAAHTATLLPGGKVLVTGGATGVFGTGPVLRSAELYDPRTGRWMAAGSMRAARASHTATLLPTGRVLVAGGESGQLDGSSVLASAELYDPGTGLWATTGTMVASRYDHSATLLSDGTVLVAGGQSESVAGQALSSAEIYNPRTAIWMATGGMASARTGHTATLLAGGRVLVTGGNAKTAVGPTLPTTETYDPHAPRTTATIDTGKPRAQFTATLLPSGMVLVTGGIYAPPSRLARSSAELYNTTSGVWTTTGAMHEARASQTATLLRDGRVLVTGGFNSTGILDSAEIYDPRSGSWAATGRLHVARAYHTATLLPDGTVLVVGGLGQTGSALPSAEVYSPGTGAWRLTGTMSAGRASQTATMLADGRVLVAGGISGKADRVLASAEVYDPRLGRWARTGSLARARAGHTATLLPNGQVLVVGGQSTLTSDTVLSSAEVYTPGTGAWRAAGTMTRERVNHTATLLPNGTVLVVGGEDSSGADSNEIEIYSARANTWTVAHGSIAAHASHVAVVLANGSVLVAGGLVAGFEVLSFAEVYDPRAGRWLATGSM
jgi:N-acetylneuraminic acid mutarotase